MTINEIARMAGVSRGTVDRVIHNRGRVSPEIQERIQQIIRQTGFTPNLAASALRRSTNELRIGVIIPALSNLFYEEVLNGFRQAQQHYAQYGVTVIFQFLPEMTARQELQAIQELLRQKVDGIAMPGIDTPEINARMEQLDSAVPIVTYNSDSSCRNRLCFVGQNHILAGRTAGNLLCSSLRRPGTVVPLVSYNNIPAHCQRVEGFCSVLSDCPVEVRLTEPVEVRESDDIAYREVTRLIRRDPDITCFFVAGGGQIGAADALADSGRQEDIMMLCYDLLPRTIAHLKSGVVNYTIGQQPFLQGYLPVSILYQYLALAIRPSREYFYTAIDIRVRENADTNGITSLPEII